MHAADYLVSNSIRHASALGRYRVDLYCLYRRPLSFPSNNHNHPVKREVRLRACLSAGARSDQATPDSIRPLCSPTSQRLNKINFSDVFRPGVIFRVAVP